MLEYSWVSSAWTITGMPVSHSMSSVWWLTQLKHIQKHMSHNCYQQRKCPMMWSCIIHHHTFTLGLSHKVSIWELSNTESVDYEGFSINLCKKQLPPRKQFSSEILGHTFSWGGAEAHSIHYGQLAGFISCFIKFCRHATITLCMIFWILLGFPAEYSDVWLTS